MIQALLPILEHTLLNALVSKEAPLMRKSKFGLGLYAVSGLLLLTCVAFLIAAGHSWLSLNFSAPVALALTAAGTALIAVLSAIAAHFIIKSKQKVETPAIQTEDVSRLVMELGEVAGEELMEQIKENPKTAMLLAGAAGFLAAEKLH